MKDDDLKLSVYIDADYANKGNDKGLVPGIAVMVGGTHVNASSTAQQCVTLPTSEAEIVALFTKALLDFLQPGLVRETVELRWQKIQSAGVD